MATYVKGTIWGGVTFSASPATEIVIPTGYLANENVYDKTTKTITIPNGVKVIELYASCNSDGHIDEAWVSITVSSNNKQWYSNGDINNVASTEYIGVTPNKQYTVTVVASGEDEYQGYFYIKYSPEINNKTPTIYDY